MFFTCLCQRQNITVAFLTCFHEEYVHWLGNCAFALLISKVQRESYVMTCSSKRFRRKCVLLMCFCHERVLLACLLSKSQLDSCGFDLLVQYQRFISGLYEKYEKKRCHFCWMFFDCCASDYWFLNSVPQDEPTAVSRQKLRRVAVHFLNWEWDWDVVNPADESSFHRSNSIPVRPYELIVCLVQHFPGYLPWLNHRSAATQKVQGNILRIKGNNLWSIRQKLWGKGLRCELGGILLGKMSILYQLSY